MSRGYRSGMCAVFAFLVSACAFDVAEQTAALRACTTADQAWRSDPLGQSLTRTFRVELDATPSASPTDAVIGLAAGATSAFSQLAAIVRFNAAGSLDVRDGGVYRVDRVVPYQAGATYRIGIEVDVPRHTYSVDVRRADGVTWDRIARNYAFRSEQAGVTSLAVIATKLDGAGTLGMCFDDPRILTGPCDVVSAGGGFANVGVPSASTVIVAEVVTTPSTTPLDAVHGLSLGAADAFGDLAAAFRFAPNGQLDARDGDVYRADAPLAYAADVPHRVRIIADLASRTYSVQAARSGDTIEIARSHRFRTQQATVAALDNFASIVDSPSGSVELCERQVQMPPVVFRRAGAHAVVADASLVSDGRTTQRIGDAGQTLATFARGGELAVDDAGTIYVARISGATLAVDSLTPALALRWSRTYPTSATRVEAMAATSAGDITIVTSNGTRKLLRQITSTGAARWTRDLGVVGVAPNRAGYAVVATSAGSVTAEQRDRDGNIVWTRTWPNSVEVHAVAAAPTGQVVFAGSFSGSINFGGATFPAHPPNENGVQNAFVVGLAASGAHVFSNRMSESSVTAIASNGTQTVVAGHHYIGPILTTLYTFDASGTITDWKEGLPGFGWFGRTYRVAVSAAGRVFWSYGPSWPDNFTEWPQLVAY